MIARIVNTVCFWLLAGVAYVLFVVAVLMPQVREYRGHLRTEEQMRQSVELLERKLSDTEDKLALLRERDPQMMDKMARDVLHRAPPPGQSVPVTLSRPPQSAAPTPPGPEGSAPLDGRLTLSGRQAAEAIEATLADPETAQKLESPRVQRLLLLMSGASICMAFIFFGAPPRRRTEPARGG